MEESGSAARLILVVLGDHGQTSDAKARWRSNHRLLVRWYQIVPSIQDHPKSAWKSLVETSSWNHQPTGSTKSATADRITWQEDMRGMTKQGGWSQKIPETWKSAALCVDYVASGAHVHDWRILDTLQKIKVSYQACQRDPGGMINHPFREFLSIILAIMWLGNVGKLLVAPWLRIQWGIWISVLAAASWLPPNQQTVI